MSPSALRQVTKSGQKLGPSTRVRIADQHLLSHNTLNDSEDTKYDERLTKALSMDDIDDENFYGILFFPSQSEDILQKSGQDIAPIEILFES